MTGIVIIGPSRSGTSLTAGILATHGVFFGDCMEPSSINRKGFFENDWLKESFVDPPDDWPDAWFSTMINEGWVGEPWGIKIGPERWDIVSQTKPIAAIMCWRPLAQIMASRQRIDWPGGEDIVKRAWILMSEIEQSADCQIIHVSTDSLARGNFDSILPAFDAVNIEFDNHKAMTWLEPKLWHR